jgi:hypothetical protein
MTVFIVLGLMIIAGGALYLRTSRGNSSNEQPSIPTQVIEPVVEDLEYPLPVEEVEETPVAKPAGQKSRRYKRKPKQ